MYFLTSRVTLNFHQFEWRPARLERASSSYAVSSTSECELVVPGGYSAAGGVRALAELVFLGHVWPFL